MIVSSGSRGDVLFMPIPLAPYSIRLFNATSHNLLFKIFLFFFSDVEGLVQTMKTLIIDEASRSHFNFMIEVGSLQERFGRVATCSAGGEEIFVPVFLSLSCILKRCFKGNSQFKEDDCVLVPQYNVRPVVCWCNLMREAVRLVIYVNSDVPIHWFVLQKEQVEKLQDFIMSLIVTPILQGERAGIQT